MCLLPFVQYAFVLMYVLNVSVCVMMLLYKWLNINIELFYDSYENVIKNSQRIFLKGILFTIGGKLTRVDNCNDCY